MQGCATGLGATGCLLLLAPTVVIGLALTGLLVYAFWPW